MLNIAFSAASTVYGFAFVPEEELPDDISMVKNRNMNNLRSVTSSEQRRIKS